MSVDKFGRFSSLRSGKRVVGERGPPGQSGIGFKLTTDGNFDLEYKILKNIGSPVDSFDAVSKSFLQDVVKSLQADYSDQIEDTEGLFVNYFKNFDEKINNAVHTFKTEMDARVQQLEMLLEKFFKNFNDYKNRIDREIDEINSVLDTSKILNEKLLQLLQDYVYIEMTDTGEQIIKIKTEVANQQSKK